MKRSGAIRLVLMGTTALSLSACEEPQVDALVFRSVEECQQAAELSADECRGQQATAERTHVQTSPKYASVADCEADFGAGECEIAPYQTSSGGSVFMPLMAGFMMGQLLGGGFGSGVATQPLYRSRGASDLRTADNQSVGGATGRVAVSRSAAAAPTVKTSTIRRGGFGASARAYSATSAS